MNTAIIYLILFLILCPHINIHDFLQLTFLNYILISIVNLILLILGIMKDVIYTFIHNKDRRRIIEDWNAYTTYRPPGFVGARHWINVPDVVYKPEELCKAAYDGLLDGYTGLMNDEIKLNLPWARDTMTCAHVFGNCMGVLLRCMDTVRNKYHPEMQVYSLEESNKFCSCVADIIREEIQYENLHKRWGYILNRCTQLILNQHCYYTCLLEDVFSSDRNRTNFYCWMSHYKYFLPRKICNSCDTVINEWVFTPKSMKMIGPFFRTKRNHTCWFNLSSYEDPVYSDDDDDVLGGEYMYGALNTIMLKLHGKGDTPTENIKDPSGFAIKSKLYPFLIISMLAICAVCASKSLTTMGGYMLEYYQPFCCYFGMYLLWLRVDKDRCEKWFAWTIKYCVFGFSVFCSLYWLVVVGTACGVTGFIISLVVLFTCDKCHQVHLGWHYCTCNRNVEVNFEQVYLSFATNYLCVPGVALATYYYDEFRDKYCREETITDNDIFDFYTVMSGKEYIPEVKKNSDGGFGPANKSGVFDGMTWLFKFAQSKKIGLRITWADYKLVQVYGRGTDDERILDLCIIYANDCFHALLKWDDTTFRSPLQVGGHGKDKKNKRPHIIPEEAQKVRRDHIRKVDAHYNKIKNGYHGEFITGADGNQYHWTGHGYTRYEYVDIRTGNKHKCTTPANNNFEQDIADYYASLDRIDKIKPDDQNIVKQRIAYFNKVKRQVKSNGTNQEQSPKIEPSKSNPPVRDDEVVISPQVARVLEEDKVEREYKQIASRPVNQKQIEFTIAEMSTWVFEKAFRDKQAMDILSKLAKDERLKRCNPLAIIPAIDLEKMRLGLEMLINNSAKLLPTFFDLFYQTEGGKSILNRIIQKVLVKLDRETRNNDPSYLKLLQLRNKVVDNYKKKREKDLTSMAWVQSEKYNQAANSFYEEKMPGPLQMLSKLTGYSRQADPRVVEVHKSYEDLITNRIDTSNVVYVPAKTVNNHVSVKWIEDHPDYYDADKLVAIDPGVMVIDREGVIRSQNFGTIRTFDINILKHEVEIAYNQNRLRSNKLTSYTFVHNYTDAEGQPQTGFCHKLADGCIIDYGTVMPIPEELRSHEAPRTIFWKSIELPDGSTGYKRYNTAMIDDSENDIGFTHIVINNVLRQWFDRINLPSGLQPYAELFKTIVDYYDKVILTFIATRSKYLYFVYSLRSGYLGIDVKYSKTLSAEIKKIFYGGVATTESKAKIYLACQKDKDGVFAGSWLHAQAEWCDELDEYQLHPQEFLDYMGDMVKLHTGRPQATDGTYPHVLGVNGIQKFNRRCCFNCPADPMQDVNIKINENTFDMSCFNKKIENYCMGPRLYQYYHKMYPAGCPHNHLAAVSNRLYKYFGNDINNPKFDWKKWGDDFIARLDKYTDFHHFVSGRVTINEILNEHGGKKGEAYWNACETTKYPKFSKLIIKNEPVKMKDYNGVMYPDKPRAIVSSGKLLTIIFHHTTNEVENRVLANSFCAKGLSSADKAQLLVSKAQGYEYYICTDGTRFDAHVNRFLIRFEQYVLNRLAERLGFYFDFKTFERKILGNNNITLRFPEGGRKSGDPWTSFFNCLINCSVGLYFKENYGIDFLNDGDDMVWFTHDKEIGSEIEALYKMLGIESRCETITDKITEVEFCQCKPYESDHGWIMVRDPMKTLQGLIFWREKPYTKQWTVLMCAKLTCCLQQYPTHYGLRNIAIHFIHLHGEEMRKYLKKHRITELDLLHSRGLNVNPTIPAEEFQPELGDWVFDLWGTDREKYDELIDEFQYNVFHKVKMLPARIEDFDEPIADISVQDLLDDIIRHPTFDRVMSEFVRERKF